jgi:type I restriction enzyme S subunit
MQDGRIVTDRIARVDSKHVERLRQHKLRLGDVVYSRRGDVGRFAVVSETEAGWLCGTGSIRIRLNCPDIDIAYVRRYLQQPAVSKWLGHHAKGVTMPNLNTTIIRALPFVHPPLPEQRRIAAILDEADALRAKRRAALAQLDTLTQSIFLDMFGDPTTNPKGWPIAPLEALGEISTGKTPPTKNNGMFGGDIPFATPGDLDSGLETTQRTITREGAAFTKIVRAGSALVGCIGSIGKMAKAPVATAFNQQINAVVWGEAVDDEYGVAALSFTVPQMLARASSTTVPILNKTGFSQVMIPAPPLAVQRDFAQHVAAARNLRNSQSASLEKLDALFVTLQHRAFRGEL